MSTNSLALCNEERADTGQQRLFEQDLLYILIHLLKELEKKIVGEVLKKVCFNLLC